MHEKSFMDFSAQRIAERNSNSLVLKMLIHSLKSQEPSVLDDRQESELVKILEGGGFRKVS